MVIQRDRKAHTDSVVTGHLLVMICIGVAVGILILIGVLFFVGLPDSEPSIATLNELGVAGDAAVQAIENMRTERFESIKALARLLVIALAVPMLALVLGYFTERQTKAQRRAAAERAAAAEDPL
ncbi:MAG: hypothetical protein ACT4OM_02190 [Actinomycetota bacterium]